MMVSTRVREVGVFPGEVEGEEVAVVLHEHGRLGRDLVGEGLVGGGGDVVEDTVPAVARVPLVHRKVVPPRHDTQA